MCKIKSVNVIHLANLSAIILLCLGIITFLLNIIGLGFTWGGNAGLIQFILTPIIGWVFGAINALVANLGLMLIGGVEIELDQNWK